MSTRTRKRTPEQRGKDAIVEHGKWCEDLLTLASFAERKSLCSPGMVTSLRVRAKVHSEEAFKWARHLAGGASV
jgi:hypothetical protein